MKLIYYRPTKKDHYRYGLWLAELGKRKGKRYNRVIATATGILSNVPDEDICQNRAVVFRGKEVPADSPRALKSAVKMLAHSVAVRRELYPPKSRTARALRTAKTFIKTAKAERSP